eukprot:9982373-Ditylum_brightwellii.AAC.1
MEKLGIPLYLGGLLDATSRHCTAVDNIPCMHLKNKKYHEPTALLIDVTCPMDINMVSAATKKHQKYQDLEIAMKKQYKLCKIQTVPI